MKCTLGIIGIARKRSLRFLALKLIQDLPVGDVASLIILLYKQAFLEADATRSIRHHGITGLVRLADITVDAFPAIVTVARLALSRLTILPIRKRAAQRVRTIDPSKAGRTVASSVGLAAWGELVTLKVFEVAVEAWRAVLGSLLEAIKR